MTAGGTWTYTLDNSNSTVESLNNGQSTTDTFTVTTVDGTAKVVTITINGTNDAAVISGTRTEERRVGKEGRTRRAGTHNTKGTVTDSDVGSTTRTVSEA